MEGGCRLPSSGNGCSAEFLSPWPASPSSGPGADGQGLCRRSVNSSWSRGEGSRVDMECPGPRDLEGPEAGPFPRREFSVSTGSLPVALGGPRQGLRRPPAPRVAEQFCGTQAGLTVGSRSLHCWGGSLAQVSGGPGGPGHGRSTRVHLPVCLSLLYLPLHLSLQASPLHPCSSAPAGRPLPSS